MPQLPPRIKARRFDAFKHPIELSESDQLDLREETKTEGKETGMRFRSRLADPHRCEGEANAEQTQVPPGGVELRCPKRCRLAAAFGCSPPTFSPSLFFFADGGSPLPRKSPVPR